MNINFHWILPTLAIGGRIHPHQYVHLFQEHEVTHVVDLRSEDCDDCGVLARHRVEFLHLPTPDLTAVSMEMLDQGVEWVNRALNHGGRVLVHCEHGIGRSALLVLCVLVSQGKSPHEALELAKTVRAQVSPSPEQIHALIEWTKRRTQPNTPMVGWQELADIAYRHLKRS